ncbi:spindle and kinetochore-associated protein 3 isoform X2 [Colius striatus]|uniref:spindle and kinetochore-associated protein 3 isoform X2 n=1 Tax=Colius striatus TaxID=57412 RepID=UPI002B1D2D33|nr:spindle and kinetochore-associated protein 3 isoform X2 [Colius striatus]
MSVCTEFFGKLRALALTLEKETGQLERALRREDADYEDEPPVRVLHDLHCELRALKEDVNASLSKSCSEKQEIDEFMKASEILMQRNAADLGKIRELFQKYDDKPHAATEREEGEVSSDSVVSVQNKPEEEKPDDVPHLSACAEKPPAPKDLLQNPQLSDFGLSHYAFSKPCSAVKGQQAANAGQGNSNNRTPLQTHTPRVLPKTPKCMLQMDDYVCATPKLEHFGISEHTMCLNEDYTMSLIRKTAQICNKLVKDNHEVKVPEMTSREIMVTPGPKPKVTAENAADWMTSPMVLVFCTPDMKSASRRNNTVLPRSPEKNESPLPSHAETPRFPDFETRWLKTEAKVKQGEKTESVTKNDVTEKQCVEERIPFAMSSDEYLKHFEDPSPPKIKHYDQLLSTPPPPEITRIPDDVLQILSKYNRQVDTSKAKEMEAKAGSATKYKSDFTDYSNKENRAYPGFFKPNI